MKRSFHQARWWGHAGPAYCRALARASGSNFYYALWLLPAARREAMFAVYGLCRAVDDAVDRGGPVEQAQRDLARWRQEVADCYAGQPVHPIAQALQKVVATYQIPQQLWLELLDGMAMDLTPPPAAPSMTGPTTSDRPAGPAAGGGATPRRYATFAELERYCYHVAGVVGLIAIRVFGCRRPESETTARALGTAFQLTNILRDLAEDAARGRCYLPQDDLARFGVREDALSRGGSPRLAELLAFEAARARQFLAQARAAVTPEDRRALTPALAMAAVYEGLLDRLAAVHYEVTRPIRLPAPRKLWLALRGALRG